MFLFESWLTICVVVLLPVGLMGLFEPCYRNFQNQKLDAGLFDDTFIVGGEVCGRECIRRELSGTGLPVDLSIVVPAFNEEKRLPVMLDSVLDFMGDYRVDANFSYEVIVVDDYSTDGTSELVLDYVKKSFDQKQAEDRSADIRLLKLRRNHGKGGAIKRGTFHSRGKYVLFADADGATDIKDLDKLLTKMQSIELDSPKLGGSVGMTIGSRAHLENKSIANRSFYRTVLMHGFHFLVSILCTSNVKDTQCGFKLFTAQTAKLLFTNLHLEGWAFDIELIYLAESLGIPMGEESVVWNEIEGSKLIQNKFDVVKTSILMARDMLCVRVAYYLRIWNVIDTV